MTTKELIETIKDLPDDTHVCLSTIHYLSEDKEGEFEMIFDYPISGIAYNKRDNEVRFAIKTKKHKDAYALAAFGGVLKKIDE
jgi:hypothetical protein